nr:uncharacterized protein LOC117691603 [Crassostrea gigas]
MSGFSRHLKTLVVWMNITKSFRIIQEFSICHPSLRIPREPSQKFQLETIRCTVYSKMKLLIWLSLIAIVNAGSTVVRMNGLNSTLSIVHHNIDSSNQEVAGLVYNHLTSTYPGRNWFVVVYDDVTGTDYHQISYCGGGFAFRYDGFNLMIASSSSDAPSMSVSDAESILYLPIINYLGICCPYAYLGAGAVLDQIDHYVDCRNYSGLAVIEQWANVAVRASQNRFVRVNRYPYSMIIFS